MSTVTVAPGALIVFGPSEKRRILFDFDEMNLPVGVTLSSYVLTIEAVHQGGATMLTADNAVIVGGNRMVRARFLATTATLGDRYRVSVKAVTNETPPQEKEYAVDILVQDH